MCTNTTGNTELPVVQPDSSCTCCSTGSSTDTSMSIVDQGRVQLRFAVTGLTCGHCATAVTSGLESVPGVSTVQVGLVAGGVSWVEVAGTQTLTDEQISSALAEAGDYQLSPGS
jgi:copper chaperone